jgi:predicted signal transduction protein with EAL and GGDEF domain
VAEETGVIITLGNWITAQAAKAAVQWPEDVTIAVNLSPLQIRAPGAALGILNALKEAGLPPHRLELEVTDSEIEDLIREQAELSGDDPETAIKQVFDSGRQELLRSDLRLRKALDRVAGEAKRIPVEVARAREEIWTPDKESQPTETKLWTPGSKEPA